MLLDVWTTVITDKESLKIWLQGLTVKELKGVIKSQYLLAYKGILKENNKDKLIEYVLFEANRQMTHATII